MSRTPDVTLRRLALLSLLAAAVGLAVAVGLGLAHPAALAFGYLAAFMLTSGAALGCLALLMLHHLVRGRWGWSIRRPLETGLATVPLLVPLFVPLLLGMHRLYPWLDAARVAANEELGAKTPYLNLPFFLARAVVFFSLWLLGAWVLRRWSRRDEGRGDEVTPLTVRLRRLAAAGLVVWGLTVTFAGIDWMASLEPTWYSTIVGLYVLVGYGLTALAAVTLVVTLVPAVSGLPEIDRGALHDLGNLLLTAVILHAYMGFSQFFIIWNGNQFHEIEWYVPRLEGVWGGLALLGVVIHFALPFLALLFRRIKRDPRLLRWVCVLILAARALDASWMVLPARTGWTPAGAAVAVAALVGMAALWAALYLWLLSRPTPPLPAAAREAA